MKQIQKKGLWSILKPVNFEIYTAMILSSIGAISLILSLSLLAFTLSNIFMDTPIEILGFKLDLFNTIVILAILNIISFSTKSLSFTISHLGAYKLEQILRTDLSLHLAKVPMGYITTTGSGALKKVIQNDVLELHTFVADTTPLIAKSIIAPILTFAILVYVDYRLALASIFVMLIGIIPISYIMKDATYNRKLYQEAQAKVNNAVIEFAQAMPIVRTFDDGSSSFKRYNNSLYNFRDKLNKWMEQNTLAAKLGILILSPLPTLFIVIVTSVYLLHNGTLEFSSFVLALFLSTGMADALSPIMWLNDFIRKSQASALRIFELLEIKPLAQVQKSKTPKNHDLVFENVSFSYDGSEKKALKNISFKVASGSITALVGPSGAGKSTVAKLIPRFWDVSEGSIKIGEVNIKDISNEDLMDLVSFVFQDTFLFADTIFNNIKMANPNATDEQVKDAARAAQIHEFIQSLPNGYETKAGDRGANLSGGQKQRITIARAILRDNPIVVLDEATAFADPENEEEIIKALANLMENKTVIVIAHRLSTIKDVDQIVVIDKGELIEKGKHDELLKNKKIYHQLWSDYLKVGQWNMEVKSNIKKEIL